ncbi:MAG: hypothetical protein RBU30_13010, partial [Polyangia bacterium]|nr:hypothetical protein [Polyangia bacterium]
MEMISTIDLLLLLGVGLLAALLGLFAGRSVRSVEQFLTAGRGASGLLVAVSLFAGTGSALLMVGAVGVFGERGVGGLRPLLAVWLWLPLLVWVWAPVLQRGRMVTVP